MTVRKINIRIKRVYEKPDKSDGARILVDRLWPRGVKKENAKIDLWLKDIAPTDTLRKWFNHDENKWEDFKNKYNKELKDNLGLFSQLEEYIKKGKVTLVYSAKDEKHNNAVVLKEYLEKLYQL